MRPPWVQCEGRAAEHAPHATVTIVTIHLEPRELWRRIAAMEMEIYRSQDYPKQVLAKLERMPPLAHVIANRWMRGWPQAVQEHLRPRHYLKFLKRQEQEERKVLSSPNLNHLAQHEIMDLYGLSPKPPF